MNDYRDVHGSKEVFSSYVRTIEDSSMSNYQKKKIKQFVEDLQIGKAGSKVKERRIGLYLQFLTRLHEYIKKDIDKLSDKELTNFYKDLQEGKVKRKNGMPYAQASKDEFTKTLKRYLGWSWGKDSKKYSASVRWMKEDYKGSNKRAITLKDVEKVLLTSRNVRDDCLFMFLFDSGARIEEALNVKINDLNNAKDYFLVHLRGQKTEESNRTISIPLTTKYLNKWLEEHPTKDKEDFLFPIEYDNARKIIKLMSLKYLGFALKPHELRHSSATHYIQNGGFGAENIGGFYYRYGWKFGSKEALTYIKQYLYGGEIGQDKVVKAIISDRIENLEKQIADLKKREDNIKIIVEESIQIGKNQEEKYQEIQKRVIEAIGIINKWDEYNKNREREYQEIIKNDKQIINKLLTKKGLK